MKGLQRQIPSYSLETKMLCQYLFLEESNSKNAFFRYGNPRMVLEDTLSRDGFTHPNDILWDG